jgi:hypothetical protein
MDRVELFILNNNNQTHHPLNESLGEIQNFIPFIYTFTIVLTTVLVLSLFFNFLSIISIFSYKKFTPINVLVLNLALADIIYTIGIPLFIAQMYHKNWPYGKLGCRLFIFADFIGIIVSVNTVAALSVERYIEIADTKKRIEVYSNKFKLLTVWVFMFIVWSMAIIFSMPMIMSIQLDTFFGTTTCHSKWSDILIELFFSFKFLFIFLIPYAVIIISSIKLLIFLHKWRASILSRKSLSKIETVYSQISPLNTSNLDTSSRRKGSISPNCLDLRRYIRIFIHLKDLMGLDKCFPNKSIRSSAVLTQVDRNPTYLQSDLVRYKASRLVMVIVILFLVQWSPLWIFQLVTLFSKEPIKNIQLINLFISTLSYSNTVANPTLFIFFTLNFKKYLNNFFNKNVVR